MNNKRNIVDEQMHMPCCYGKTYMIEPIATCKQCSFASECKEKSLKFNTFSN